ncbi:MAG: hypothetical protein JSU58_10145 [Dehalococcoidales bacterium]|nr:MAG: hypothetical protein JSU58_10145 [Dehalococcoidales bacterium]
MKRIVKILGIAMVLAALLVVSIGSAVFAAENGNGPHGDCDRDCSIGGGPYHERGPHGDCDGDGPDGY